VLDPKRERGDMSRNIPFRGIQILRLGVFRRCGSGGSFRLAVDDFSWGAQSSADYFLRRPYICPPSPGLSLEGTWRQLAAISVFSLRKRLGPCARTASGHQQTRGKQSEHFMMEFLWSARGESGDCPEDSKRVAAGAFVFNDDFVRSSTKQ